MNDLLDSLRDLDLPGGEYAVFGSGPLLVRGWISEAEDLDVICRGSAWDAVSTSGELAVDERYGVTLATLCDGRITFGTRWGIGDFDVGRLIDSAEIIDGLPCVLLEHVIAYKTIRASARDLQHLDVIRRHRNRQSGGNHERR